MKKICLVGSFLIAVCSLYAQKTKSPINNETGLSVNVGIGSPGGNFSKANYADERSGFAKAGVHFNLSAAHFFNKNWGLNVLAGYTQFGKKGTGSLADGYKEDSGTDSTTLYTKGNNSTFSILVGPVYKIPVTSNFSINIRALFGYSNTHLAGFRVYYEDYLDNAMSQKEASAGTFGFQAGAGLKYSFTKHIAVLANIDYFTSKPKIDISYENFIVNSGRKLSNYHEAVNGINATLGIGFIF